MSGTLSRTSANAKPAAGAELLSCDNAGCPFAYMIAIPSNENRIFQGENVVQIMRRKAREIIADSHPPHMTGFYLWKGPIDGWKEADSPEDRRSL